MWDTSQLFTLGSGQAGRSLEGGEPRTRHNRLTGTNGALHDITPSLLRERACPCSTSGSSRLAKPRPAHPSPAAGDRLAAQSPTTVVQTPLLPVVFKSLGHTTMIACQAKAGLTHMGQLVGRAGQNRIAREDRLKLFDRLCVRSLRSLPCTKYVANTGSVNLRTWQITRPRETSPTVVPSSGKM